MSTHPSKFKLPQLAAVALALALVTQWVQAQVIDEVELKRVGDDALVSIRFVTPVQYLRSVTARSGDLGQIYYDLLPTRDVLSLVTAERRLTGASGAPIVIVTDEAAGTVDRSRKLVLRFFGETAFTARPGQGNRSIELVLQGKGALVRDAAPTAARTTPLEPPPVATGPMKPEDHVRSTALIGEAQRMLDRGEHTQAIAKLEDVLALPSHENTAQAQEMIAMAHWRQGDPERARAEYELYLKLYPGTPGAARAREALLTLAPAAPQQQTSAEAGKTGVTTNVSGSVSTFYYGGQSRVRTQEFQDSPLSGLPELISDATLSGTDQRQLITSVDLNWRRRDADSELRLVVRDTYSADMLRSDKSRNKLSAMYADYKLLQEGLSVRLGRQSPTGGGVMGRFDGVQVGYRFMPKWRINAVLGQPSDPLLDARRKFGGVSIEADELMKGFGGSLYAIEQRIDGQTDRRAIGTELRLLAGPVTALGLLDYDTKLKGLNIASLQATWQWEDNTVINVLYDRRSTPMLMLGNSLFFQNPVLAIQARTLNDVLQTQSLDVLRQQVRDTTAFSTQGMVSVTRPISANWQVGLDVRLTNVGPLAPVADILPSGQPGTGNIWSSGLQLIGTNLYSSRDTHVVLATLLKGPTYRGQLLTYNNSTQLGEGWQLEPSLRFYTQNDDTSTRSRRWAPGVRVSKRATSKLVVESEVSMEFSKTDGPARHESSNRSFYYMGVRYDL